MQTHVKVLGVLFLVCAAFLALMAIAFPVGMNLVGAIAEQSGDPDGATANGVLGLVGAGMGVFWGFFAVIYGLCGYGVLQHQSWARIFAIIISAVSLISFPVGTALGVYGLWIMFNKETEAMFTKPQPTN